MAEGNDNTATQEEEADIEPNSQLSPADNNTASSGEEKKVDTPSSLSTLPTTNEVNFADEEIAALPSSSSSDKNKDSSLLVSSPAATATNNQSNDSSKDDSSNNDNDDKLHELLSEEDKASCISSWLLLYLTPLLKLGATKVLEPNDVGPPSKCDRAHTCFSSVNSLWIAEVARTKSLNETNKVKHQNKLDKLPKNTTLKQRKKIGTFTPQPPNLAKVLWNAFGYYRVWYAIILYILSSLLQFLPVLILNDLVSYFESSDPANYNALLFHPWGNVVGLFIFPFLVSLFQTRSQVILNHCGIFIRTSVSTLLFSKALTISAAGRAQTSTGQVVNMMSNDTQQLQRFLQFFGFTLVAPIQIIISLVLIYRQVGNATWVGIAFMLCLIPINGVVFSTYPKCVARY